LERCIRHPQTAPATRASATFHLARTLAEIQGTVARELLEQLLANSASAALLSSADLKEARELLQRLKAETTS
jgi:hypothetical protein